MITYLSLLSLLVPLLTGCATSYHSMGFGGGYSETQLGENIFRVTFNGNGYTSLERAQDFALLRSAEKALSNGFTHFIIIDSNEYESMDSITIPTTSTTTGTATASGNVIRGQATTVTYGGQTLVISKPRTSNMIMCFHGKPETMGIVFNAQFIIDSITQ